MADRNQNINILFKTNTVDLEKATNLLNKAKAANDALVSSTNKLGNEGSQATQKLSNNIAGLTLQMQQLKARIDLANQSDQQRLAGLTQQYNQMQVQLNQYNANLKLTDDSIKNTTQSLSGMYNMVRLVLTAGIVKEAVSATLAMATLNGQVEGVRRAFAKLPESTKLMADLREKTHGTIDELTLMQKAVQAKNFKIPLEQLGNLLEFAAVKAQQTGLDINYLVDSLITGLGRNSIKILDNLQFSVTELRAKTKELGSTQQAVFFLVNKQLADMGGYVETSETKVKRLTTAWTNFKIAVSESGIGKVGGGIATGFAGYLDRWTEALGGKSANPMRNLSMSLDLLNEAIKRNDLGGANGIVTQLERAKKFAEEAGVELIRLTDGVKVMYAIKPHPVNIVMSPEGGEAQIGIIKSLKDQIETLNTELEESTDATGKSQMAILGQRQELERQLAVYTMSEKELDKYLQSQDAVKLSWIKSSDALEQLGKHLATVLRLENDATKNRQATGQILPITNPSTGQAMQSSSGTPNTSQADFRTWYDQYATFWDKLAQGFDDLGHRIHKSGQMTIEDQRQMFQKAARALLNVAPQITDTFLQAGADSEQASYDARIKASSDYYNKQIELAGDNTAAVKRLQEKAKKEQEKLEAEKIAAQKRAAIRRIEIDTAINVVKSILENGGIPWGLPEGAAAAALGIAQVIAVKGFKKGVIDLQGPGTGTSDSIPARLSKGESVMTAEETRANMGILKAIRAKTINDRMLNAVIAKNGGSQAQKFDDSRIVGAIKSQPKQDVIKIGSMVFEAQRDKENRTRIVRNKYLG